jgi:hypothetical protein
VVDFKRFDGGVPGNDRFERGAELGNVPLTVAEPMELLADGVFRRTHCPVEKIVRIRAHSRPAIGIALRAWMPGAEIACLPDGRGHYPEKSLYRHPTADRRTAAAVRTITGVNGLVVMSFSENLGSAVFDEGEVDIPSAVREDVTGLRHDRPHS